MKQTTSFQNLRVRATAFAKISTMKAFVMPLLLGLLLMTGCKEQETVDPTFTVTAKAGADQSVQVGQQVSLDGSESSDSQGKPLTIEWKLLRKPAKSTVILANAASFKPTFTPDEIGEYELELTVSSTNGKSTDKVLVTASIAEPLAITVTWYQEPDKKAN